MKCPKCGCQEQFSGAIILDNGFQYELGCEGCDYFVCSEIHIDLGLAVSQAREKFKEDT